MGLAYGLYGIHFVLDCLQVEVDFEDKETCECLFKEYWLGLKNRLSLTLPELDKDGKLAKTLASRCRG